MCSQRKEISLGQSPVLRGNGKTWVTASWGRCCPQQQVVLIPTAILPTQLLEIYGRCWMKWFFDSGTLKSCLGNWVCNSWAIKFSNYLCPLLNVIWISFYSRKKNNLNYSILPDRTTSLHFISQPFRGWLTSKKPPNNWNRLLISFSPLTELLTIRLNPLVWWFGSFNFIRSAM